MNIKTRLEKLEASTQTNKPLLEMTDAELERFLVKHYDLPNVEALTDEMLWKIIEEGKFTVFSTSHEEALDAMANK